MQVSSDGGGDGASFCSLLLSCVLGGRAGGGAFRSLTRKISNCLVE